MENVDFENQREATPPEIVDKQGTNYNLQQEGIIDFEQVQTRTYGAGGIRIFRLNDQIDPDNLKTKFEEEREYSQSRTVEEIDILEGKDNIYENPFLDDSDKERKSAVVIEDNYLLHCSENTVPIPVEEESRLNPLNQLEKSINAHENNESILDTVEVDGETIPGELHQLSQDPDSFLYQEGIIDFMLSPRYDDFEPYPGDEARTLDQSETDTAIGVEQKNGTEKVEMYRTTFSSEGIVDKQYLGEFDASMFHWEEYPLARYPKDE